MSASSSAGLDEWCRKEAERILNERKAPPEEPSSSPSMKRELKKQKTDDGATYPELMTDAEMRQEARPQPPPQAATPDFWTAMRALVREENNDVKTAVISLGWKINAVEEGLAGRLDEEAGDRQELQSNENSSLKSFNERLERLELRPPTSYNGDTSGGDWNNVVVVGPDLCGPRKIATEDRQGDHRTTSGGTVCRRTCATLVNAPSRRASTAP